MVHTYVTAKVSLLKAGDTFNLPPGLRLRVLAVNKDRRGFAVTVETV